MKVMFPMFYCVRHNRTLHGSPEFLWDNSVYAWVPSFEQMVCDRAMVRECEPSWTYDIELTTSGKVKINGHEFE